MYTMYSFQMIAIFVPSSSLARTRSHPLTDVSSHNVDDGTSVQPQCVCMIVLGSISGKQLVQTTWLGAAGIDAPLYACMLSWRKWRMTSTSLNTQIKPWPRHNWSVRHHGNSLEGCVHTVGFRPPSFTRARPMEAVLKLPLASNGPGNEDCHYAPASTHAARIDLQASIIAVPLLDDRTTDGIADQCRKRYDCKHSSSSHANLSYIGDLGNHCRKKGDEGAAAETEEGGERDDGCVVTTWEPQR